MIGVPELEKILPHRHPMLLVDRVTRVVPGQTLTAVKAVTANEPWYAPGIGPKSSAAAHAYPQVLLIESWCQAAGVLATWERPNPDVLTGDVMLFGSLSGIEFADPVLPGSIVEHHVRLVRSLGDTLVFEGDARVDGRPVMTVGQVLMAMRPAQSLRPQPISQ